MKKVALITGASRGIGFEVVRYFASRDYNVILLARDKKKLTQIAKNFREEFAVITEVIAADMSDFPLITALVGEKLKKFGRLDALVNAAGIFYSGSATLPTEQFSTMLEVNITAIHHLCQLCHPFMGGEKKSGWIFNIASVSGVKPYAGIAGYVASKHALVGYSLSIGRELLPQGIKVTVLCPDVVNTDMSASSGLKEDEKLSTGDITRAIEFIMSLSPSATIEQLTINRKPASAGN